MPSIEQYLTRPACEQLRKAIVAASGGEVFFVARPDDHGQIDTVREVCRGGPRAVMRLFSAPQFGDVVIHNHPSGLLLPTRSDEEIAARFDGKGIGFLIVDNDVSDLYALVEPFREEAPTVQLDEDEVAGLLGPEGPLAKNLYGYEERKEQADMLRHVVRAFNREEILMVEAGTGTGKSLAYLLPAVLWARRNRQRVVISTNTINLQQQLCTKDIPFLQEVLGEPFQAVLVKGRQNYLCLRKLHQQAATPPSDEDEEALEDFHLLMQWAQSTTTGDRADLTFMPKETVWSSIATESDTCQRNRCESYRSCFYYMARRKQANADILVTNHHIFFADLAVRHAMGNYQGTALLPPYQMVVLDEAHNIEDAASSFLGSQISRIGVLRALGMLLKSSRGGQEGGLLMQLADQIFKLQHSIRDAESLRQQIFEYVIPTVRRQRQRTMRLCEQMHQHLASIQEGGHGTVKLRVTEAFVERGPWQPLLEWGLDWADELRGVVHEVLRLYHRLEQATSRHARAFSGFLMDMEGAANRLQGAAAALDLFFRQPGEVPDEPGDIHEYVRWFEFEPNESGKLRLMMAPLEIGLAMKRMLYDRLSSVVFTSATLATDQQDFSYVGGRLGIPLVEPERATQALFASPFDYATQSMIAIPSDIPNPQEAPFEDVITEVIFRAIQASGGRAFVLCTSFRLMNSLHQSLAERLSSQLGLRSLCQGSAPRHQILQQKIQDPTSVLFGTDSFWEGVDVRGEALSNVILTRLPFRVPSEPLIEARMEAIDAKGGNSFARYTVPAATIKFKQGFGRLIRAQSDRGTVLILDKRVIHKGYGKRFLRSLPDDCPRVIGTTEHVLETMVRFHQGIKSF